ncbi:hypothetical protein [Cytobacillus massiliigabonensis]|uniref:hypothetical protein n=1 Tax=Cytobacillus massiliigabonensis TaxID=1871011 RepID=UPI0011585BD9|nr:hypothetical protein [Cytobacillus massiliigabonensis]
MYLGEFDKKTLLHTYCNPKFIGWTQKYNAFYKVDLETLMSALVNGYEIEKTPEEKIRDYYYGLKGTECSLELRGQSGSQFRQGWQSVRETLDILGITIEGINA